MVSNSAIYYLDHAAATPVADFVLKAMMPYMTDKFYNPSSPYAPAIQTRHDYQDAKSKLAKVIGAKADEVTMTAGATESINLMFAGVSGHVVTSSIEHPAVLKASERHERTVVKPNQYGTITPEAVKTAIQPGTVLVSIALANNEIGTIQPIKDIAMVVEQERIRRSEAGAETPLYFHTDASQGAGYVDLHVNRLGADAVTLNAGKVYGPKQVGLLWTGTHVRLQPTIVGGGQESGLRSGTENVAGAVGFAEALSAADGGRNAEADRIRRLRDKMQQVLCDEFPTAVISGNLKKRLPNFLHISFPGLDAERILFALEMEGVLVATGSACSANKGMRSHVLTEIGLEPSVADGSVRITLGKLNDADTIKAATDIIISTVKAEMDRVGV